MREFLKPLDNDLPLRGRQSAPWSQLRDSPSIHAFSKLSIMYDQNREAGSTRYRANKLHRFLLQYMPETVSGEHARRADSLSCYQERPRGRQEILEIFLFMISNNLKESLLSDDRDESSDNRIIVTFEALSLIGCPWRVLFSSKDPTVVALTDALFASTIRLCRVDILQQLTKSGLDFHDESIALSNAMRKRHFKLCKILLDRGLWPLERGFPPLHCAAWLGEIDILRLLLSHGFDPNYHYYHDRFDLSTDTELYSLTSTFDARYNRDKRAWSSYPSMTALYIAIWLENVEIVQVLLESGARPSEYDFDCACRDGKPRIMLETLLSTGFKPTEEVSRCAVFLESTKPPKLIDAEPLAHASGALVEAALRAAHNEPSLVESVLDQRGLTVNNPCCGRDPFETLAVITSVYFGDRKTCSVFGRYGLLQNELDLHALHAWNPENTTYLVSGSLKILRGGLDFNVKATLEWRPKKGPSDFLTLYEDHSLLQIAIETGREHIMDLLFQSGIKPTMHDVRFAMKYCKITNMRIWKRLLDLIEDVNDIGPKDVTFSSLYRMDYRTALQDACARGHFWLVRLLVGRGAHVNAPGLCDEGATALQWASLKGHIEIARFLIEVGADCNAPAAKTNGRTTLEGAAEHGRLDMVKYLLHSGVRTEGVSRRQYFRAIKFAEGETHYAVAQLLKDHRQWSVEDHDRFRNTCICQRCKGGLCCDIARRYVDGDGDSTMDVVQEEVANAKHKSVDGLAHEADGYTVATNAAPQGQVEVSMTGMEESEHGEGVTSRGRGSEVDSRYMDSSRTSPPSTQQVASGGDQELQTEDEEWTDLINWDPEDKE